MKKRKLSELINRYTIRGGVIGLTLFVLTLLFSLNSQLFLSGNRTLVDLFILFPGLWIALALPFVFGLVGYYLSKSFVKRIVKQQEKIEIEAHRSVFVLDFIENLRSGDFETDIPELKNNDQLSTSLRNLREYLIESKHEEGQRRIEEKQRAWVTQGFAQFGELLRNNNDNLEALSLDIISYLVNYLKINQGGFFLINSNDAGDKYFELKAFVAYDRRKFADKIISWGEGLIGRCGLEKETIYMTDIPNNYLNVTSGLGEANPRALLIVPLKINDEIYGVIELASFNPFEPFQIEFIEKAAESIASTIATVKINIQTAKLLRETQIQAEKMLQQEEELRQNLEEMQATQEESERREIEMKGILEAIDHSVISCEFETDGTLLSVNQIFLKTFKYSIEEVEFQNIKIFFFKDDHEQIQRILDDLRAGNNFKNRLRRRTKLGEEIFLLSTFTPVMDSEGEIIKILSLEIDVTEQVRMEEQVKNAKDELGIRLEEAKNEVKEQFKVLEQSRLRNEKTLEGALDAIVTINNDGTVEFFNLAAEKLWGFSRSEVIGNNISMLFSAETINSEEFVAAYVNPDAEKIVGERREVPIRNKFGDDVAVLFLLSEAKVGDDHSYTAFIQNIEVELF